MCPCIHYTHQQTALHCSCVCGLPQGLKCAWLVALDQGDKLANKQGPQLWKSCHLLWDSMDNCHSSLSSVLSPEFPRGMESLVYHANVLHLLLTWTAFACLPQGPPGCPCCKRSPEESLRWTAEGIRPTPKLALVFRFSLWLWTM